MAKLTWRIRNQTQGYLDITQYVRSITFTIGRPNAVSPFTGGTFSFTMTNDNGQVQYANVQDEIEIDVKGTGIFYNLLEGFVTQRQYQDGQGEGLNSTVTISGVDQIALFGPIDNIFITEFSVKDLLTEYSTAVPFAFVGGVTDLDMDSTTFETNGLQAINNVIAPDGGVISRVLYHPPSEFPAQTQTNFTFDNTISATKIGYQTLERVEGSANGTFFTASTVTNQNTGATTLGSALVAFYYGQRYVTITSAETASGSTAEWYANAFSKPDDVTLFMSFTDVAQNVAALDLAVVNLLFGQYWTSVSFTPPGGVAQTGYFWPEQISVTATPEKTSFDLIMSPLSYYGRFILNDAVFGVLDVDRLGVAQV